jgi:hypothetical protein
LENRGLSRIFGSKRGEVTGEWRRRHKEELYDLYCSSNIILLIKSRRMIWAGHVECKGERRGAAEFWWGDLRERDEFERLCVDGRTILKLIFKKWDGSMDWIDLARDLVGCFE